MISQFILNFNLVKYLYLFEILFNCVHIYKFIRDQELYFGIKNQKFIDWTNFLCLCLDICLIIAFNVTSFSKAHSMMILLSPLAYFAMSCIVSGFGRVIPPFLAYFLMNSKLLLSVDGRFSQRPWQILYSPINKNLIPSK